MAFNPYGYNAKSELADELRQIAIEEGADDRYTGMSDNEIVVWAAILSTNVMEFSMRHVGTQLHSGWFRLMKNHLMELRNLISSNVLSNSYHKSTVAHYIQQAYRCWELFLTAVNEKSLSRILTFPIDELDPMGEKKLIISDETIILIQQS